MKKNDLMTIVTVALTTATLTLVNFWPATLEAGPNASASPTAIAKPKLVVQGIEMTLATAQGRSFGAGEEPMLQLTATNTTGEPATASVNMALTASSPADTMSRVPRIPKALWRQNLPVALQPNETRTFAIAVPEKLPPGSMIAVTLGEANPNEAAATASPETKVAPRAMGLPAFDQPPNTMTTVAPRAMGLPPGGIVALRFSTATPVTQTPAPAMQTVSNK